MTGDGRMRPILRWLVIAFVIVQVAVPVAALAGPRPGRFGWQMFTTYAPVPRVWIETSDGSLSDVDLEALLVHPRPETDLTPALAAVLCQDDGVQAVLIERLGDDLARVPCR